VRHTRPRTSPSGISERDASLLGHLDERWPTSPGELARHMGVGMPALSAAVARLERQGLIARGRAGGDRRRIELRLTRAGARAMRDASVIDAARARLVLARLRPAERAAALDGLALLARAAREVLSRKEAR
jgi:DNA-binding MarR family transcriptional regulator